MGIGKMKGLGKGFDVLMPQGIDDSLLNKNKDRVQKLFVIDIEANKDQPRRTFDEQSLNELAESIKTYGVLQPLLVTPLPNGKHQIIAGERRWRASKLAGLDEVPVVIRTTKELEKLEIAIVENIQRVDLTPLEQAASINRLHELFGLGLEEIAKRLHKAPSTVNNIVRLLQLPPSALDALAKKRITEGHARSILALKTIPEQQENLLILIQKHGWSVRQAEQFVVAAKAGTNNLKLAKKRTKETNPGTKALSKILQRPVTVKHMAKGGRLVIRFDTDEDLEKLIGLLQSVKQQS
ncbi:MAG: ParB/RepB/Spo0J family partition protein [bacterium]|nr:ParB/RepB/Spo0J family partition protein [bacterium]